MAIVLFGCILPLTTPSAIEFSICNGVGVGGYGCPISSRIILMYTDSRTIMYSAANSTPVAYGMVCLIMCATLSMAPLLVDTSTPLERKKWPPVLILALGLLR